MFDMGYNVNSKIASCSDSFSLVTYHFLTCLMESVVVSAHFSTPPTSGYEEALADIVAQGRRMPVNI